MQIYIKVHETILSLKFIYQNCIDYIMKQKNNQDKSKVEKKVWINLQATETFKKKLTKYMGKIGIKQSNFIRQAIREKIESIEHPDSKIKKSEFEEIIKEKVSIELEDSRINEKLDFLLKQRDVLDNVLKDIRSQLSEFPIKDQESKTIIIIKYIKQKSRTIKDLIDLTGYEKSDMLAIVHNLEENGLAKYNVINGRVEYIE
ncbi:hypothetical protein ES706_03833 [subsurface metagenome]